MVQDLIDFLCEAVPSFEATLEVLELVLESNPMTSRVAKSHRRWIHICLMQQILPLQGEEREEWVAELFDGEQSTTELFAEKMCEVSWFNSLRNWPESNISRTASGSKKKMKTNVSSTLCINGKKETSTIIS